MVVHRFCISPSATGLIIPLGAGIIVEMVAMLWASRPLVRALQTSRGGQIVVHHHMGINGLSGHVEEGCHGGRSL
jgi:hypothetical protein